MIFGSLGLLAMAVAMLIAAIIKSSVAFGVGSLVCTVAAMALLLAAKAYYRRLTLLDPDGEHLRDLATDTWSIHRPRKANGTSIANSNGHGSAARPVGPPVDGYPDLTEAQAVKVVDTLNLDELHDLRRYEVEHANRKRVLTAIDRRVATIISLRRSLASS